VNMVAVQCLPPAAVDARRLASRLNVPIHEILLHTFPDGELRVTVGPSAATTILYVPLDQPNDKLVAIMFAAEALRRDGTARLVLVAPYLCYMRQDTVFRQGEAISQKVIGQLFAKIFDRVITVDAHLHRTSKIEDVFPGIEADDVSAIPAIAEALRAAGYDPDTIVAGPDVESEAWVRALADLLGVPWVVAQKSRLGDRSVDIKFAETKMIVRRPVLLIDDIVSSGGTLKACARALLAAGAITVDAVITHALFPPEMTHDFLNAGIRSIRSTHSVPHPTNAIALDAILGRTLLSELGVSDLPRKIP
jgi:ribose-phosphate pyrophosphokinase